MKDLRGAPPVCTSAGEAAGRAGPGRAREWILWSSATTLIGRFHSRALDRDFTTAGQVTAPTLAFADSPVRIRWGRRDPLLADVHLVVLHNLGDEYRREAVVEVGDRSIWFHFAPEVLAETLSAHGLSVPSDERRPFRSTFSPVDGTCCVLRAALVHHLDSAESPDPLFVEETALSILDRAVGSLGAGAARSASGSSAHRDLAEGAREFLSRRWRRSVRLGDVAEALGVSVYHLCRVFRKETGATMHAYLRQVRLRRSLTPVLEANRDLSSVAIEHGFGTHSRFTTSFGASFGMTPTSFRRYASGRSLPDLLRAGSR